MNFHNVVWLVVFFFSLLGHLGNSIFKGNKGTGKVEEGGIIFLYIYLKNILIDFLALVSEVFHVLRLWIAFFLLSIGSVRKKKKFSQSSVLSLSSPLFLLSHHTQ